ncbi:MAG TPA: hypothetical protein DEP66_05885 [Acidimicrobiaceae bacterium]|nr:hypothetical protein [Acidimicrobiaceae bacterium]
MVAAGCLAGELDGRGGRVVIGRDGRRLAGRHGRPGDVAGAHPEPVARAVGEPFHDGRQAGGGDVGDGGVAPDGVGAGAAA